jgi:hypothetical protein
MTIGGSRKNELFIDLVPHIDEIASMTRDVYVMPKLPRHVRRRTGN